MIEGDVQEASICFEKSEFTPTDTIVKKKYLEIKGRNLKEVRKHFDDIWGRDD